MTKRLVGQIGRLRIYTDDDLPEGHWYFGRDEPTEYGSLSCWILGTGPNNENGILKAALKLLKRLEWSGKRYYFDDKCVLPECPICHGDKPLGDEDDQYRGHSKGCELASLLRNR